MISAVMRVIIFIMGKGTIFFDYSCKFIYVICSFNVKSAPLFGCYENKYYL
jgi:hypothetical protein